MTTVKHTLTVLLGILCLFVNAQVKTDFNSDKLITGRGLFLKNYKDQTDFEVPAKNIDQLLEKEKLENEKSKGEKPFRFADPIAIDLDIAEQMDWVYEKDSAFGKFTIHLKGALSASINFDRFYLPAGTEMYIYSQNGKMITGPITEKENNPKNIWGSWVLKGGLLIIEIKTPVVTKSNLFLHANNIAYGYKEVYKEVANFGQSASCHINVLCPLGTGWEAERNSVALILNDVGTAWCSGAMIRNTCDTYRPFFLTANHCYDDGLSVQNVASWRFTFQAWSSACLPNQNSNGVTYNGSTLRANWSGTDFCLVELNNIPPENSGINYAGWNRNITGINQTTILHHPAGDVMKITRDNDAPTAAMFGGANCWRLVIDNGATEGGSSGGPYFDQNHRIIAQHYGVDDAHLPICDRTNKYGGRFDLSWTGGGTNSTRLSNWLDPTGTGATTTNTTNILTSYPSISGDNTICGTASNFYSISNLPVNGTVQWSASPSGVVTINSPTSTQTTLSVVASGVITLSATITGCANPITITKSNITVGTPNWSTLSTAYYTQGYDGGRLHDMNCLSTYFNPPGYMGDISVTDMVATSYTWTFINKYPSNATVAISYLDPRNATVSVRNYGGEVTYRLTTSNACGSYSYDYTFTTTQPCNVDFESKTMKDPASNLLAEINQFTDLLIAPNPSTGSFVVSLKNGGTIKQIIIRNSIGSIIKNYRVNNSNSEMINIENLPAAVYLVEVYDGDRWSRSKIIKN